MSESILIALILIFSTVSSAQEIVFVDSIIASNSVKSIKQTEIHKSDKHTDTTYRTYKYDKNGNLIEEVFPAGMYFKTKYMYKKRLLVEEITCMLPYDSSSDSLDFGYSKKILEYADHEFSDTIMTSQFIYNEDGLLIERINESLIRSNSTRTFFYNAQNNLVSTKKEECWVDAFDEKDCQVEENEYFYGENQRLIRETSHTYKYSSKTSEKSTTTIEYFYKKGALKSAIRINRLYETHFSHNKLGQNKIKKTYAINRDGEKGSLMGKTLYKYASNGLITSMKTRSESFETIITFSYEYH
ncbi:MAG: hypothetical protein MK105_13355 [Crocinitomicaceae bacterium]|nr:hypothetical protein [Crocinitomicaceae bacterium]